MALVSVPQSGSGGPSGTMLPTAGSPTGPRPRQAGRKAAAVAAAHETQLRISLSEPDLQTSLQRSDAGPRKGQGSLRFRGPFAKTYTADMKLPDLSPGPEVNCFANSKEKSQTTVLFLKRDRSTG